MAADSLRAFGWPCLLLLAACAASTSDAPGQGDRGDANAHEDAGRGDDGVRPDSPSGTGGSQGAAGSVPVGDEAGGAGRDQPVPLDASPDIGKVVSPADAGQPSVPADARADGASDAARPAPTGDGDTIGTIRSGVSWYDDQHQLVNAHGGCINREGDTFYLSGMYYTYSSSASKDENNKFKAFAMYSSKNLETWKFEGKILPVQASGELGPNRVGERPHIIKCPSTGEFVLYAHAASLDYQTDKEVVYATSPTINGTYTFKGALTNASGAKVVHSDMSAFVDGNNVPYVLTESGHVFKLSADCHSWLTDTAYSAMGGMESPTAFQAGDSYFWIMSEKTGWRANDNQYAAAASFAGPWTNQGLIAPAGEKTWLSQSTCVLPIVGTKGAVYLYFGDRWDGTESTDHPGQNNTLATYVFQPLVISGSKASMPKFYASWQLDAAAGTWSP